MKQIYVFENASWNVVEVDDQFVTQHKDQIQWIDNPLPIGSAGYQPQVLAWSGDTAPLRAETTPPSPKPPKPDTPKYVTPTLPLVYAKLLEIEELVRRLLARP